jgi:hypothetical protein
MAGDWIKFELDMYLAEPFILKATQDRFGNA